MRVVQARALLDLRLWDRARVQLSRLPAQEDALDPEPRAWRALFLGDAHQIRCATALANIALGRWEEARLHLHTLVGTSHEPWGVRLLAQQLEGEQQPERAIAILERTRRRFPHDLGLLQDEVEARARQGDQTTATALLERFAADHPEELPAQVVLLRWRVTRGDQVAAAAQVESLAQRFPDRPEVRLVRAEVLLVTGRPQAALALCRQLGDDPAVARACPQVARLAPLVGVKAALALAQMPEVADFLERAAAVQTRPEAQEALRGVRALALDDFKEASRRLAGTLPATALHEPARVALCRAIMDLADQDSPSAAEAQLEQLLGRFPDEPALLLVKADLAMRQGRLEDALQELDRLQGLRPDSADVGYFKAHAWLLRAQRPEALAEVVTVLRRQPDHLPAQVLAGRIVLDQGQARDALGWADGILRRDRAHTDATRLKAEALDRLGRRDEAIATLEALLGRRPGLAAACTQLARLYEAAGPPEAADRLLDAALTDRPDDPVLVGAKVRRLCRAGRVADAEASARGISARPDSLRSLGLAQAFGAEGRWLPARAWAEAALQDAGVALQPTIHGFLAHLALAQVQAEPDERLEHLTRACDHWRAALRRRPADLAAANNLAWLLATEFGRPEEARVIAEQARGDAPIGHLPVSFVDTLATIQRQLGHLTAAQNLLERRAAARPEEPLVQWHLGLVYQSQGRTVAARAAFRRAMQAGLDRDRQALARRALDNLPPR